MLILTIYLFVKSCFITFKSKVNIWEVIGITIKSQIISVNEGLEVFKTYFHNRTDKQESKYCIDTDKALSLLMYIVYLPFLERLIFLTSYSTSEGLVKSQDFLYFVHFSKYKKFQYATSFWCRRAILLTQKPLFCVLYSNFSYKMTFYIHFRMLSPESQWLPYIMYSIFSTSSTNDKVLYKAFLFLFFSMAYRDLIV